LNEIQQYFKFFMMKGKVDCSGSLTFFLIGILILTGIKLNAQDVLSSKLGLIAIKHSGPGLLIGDKVPDSIDFKTYHFHKRGMSFKALRGKLVILDFWSQYCSVCLAQFPKLAKLQTKFGDKIVILPVTFQSESSIASFFSKRERQKRPIELPTIVEDTTLNHLFPHHANSYDVWIGPSGNVMGFTYYKGVNEKLIESVLKDGGDSLKSISLDPTFKVDQPFLIEGNGGDPNAFLARYILTKSKHSIDAGFYIDSNENRIKVLITNYSIVHIYKTLFTELNSVGGYPWIDDSYANLLLNDPFNKLVVSDSTLNIDSERYCYELILPSSYSYKQAFSYMINNLNDLFHLTFSIAVQHQKCLYLVRTDSGHRHERRIKQKDVPIENTVVFRTDELVNYLNDGSPFPYIKNGCDSFSEVKMPKYVDYSHDINVLKSLLLENGFDLIERRSWFPVFVFKKNDND